MSGASGQDALFGGDGADRLVGSTGLDSLTGGNGADVFDFDSFSGAADADLILDFTSGTDQIWLRGFYFGDLQDGALNPAAFAEGTQAQQADDRILYDQATGALMFDADGSGLIAALLMATLTPGTLLTAADFLVV